MNEELEQLLKKYTNEEPIAFTTYLTARKREIEDYPNPLRDEIKKGYVVVANEESMERMIYAKSFRELGFETFVVEQARGDENGRIAIAPLRSDLEAVLWMQTGHDSDEMLPIEIVKNLGEWRDYCTFRLTGAGTNWITIEFESLPHDIYAFAGLVLDFCPDLGRGAKNDEALVEQLQNERSIFMRWRANF